MRLVFSLLIPVCLKGWLLSAHLALEAAVLFSFLLSFSSSGLITSWSPPLVYALVYKARFTDSALFVV